MYADGASRHLPGPVRDAPRELRPRGNFVRLMRVGGTTVGLVSEEEGAVAAFERALSTTVAGDVAVDRAAP